MRTSTWPLLLTLVAFARVLLWLDRKPLWWDESLSLQRAESSLGALLRGVLVIRDGFTEVPTIDQHPFFSFLLQGGLIRLAGDDEFVLRFVAVIGATLFVPCIYVLARWLARQQALPPSAPAWAALLAAVNPFMLWYGQEARPYALWASLALLTTYLLLRATEAPRLSRGHAAGFLATELMFVATHYYAVLLLPVHALIFFLWLARRSLVRALLAAALLLALGAAVGAYAAWVVVSQGGGQNFPSISLQMLVPDLVNAFSLGLSVDLAQVWWIDLGVGLLALAGALWGLSSRSALRQGGWILPLALLAPIGLLLLLNEVRPLYMNARHMSMLVGIFLLLVAGGIGWLAVRWRWAAAAVAVGLVVAAGYSTVNYFTREEYAKDDYVRLGEYMAGRIVPGDVVLYYPPSSWRIFEYYVPLAPVKAAAAEGAGVAVYGAPLLRRSWEETEAWLQELGDQYRRVWIIRSGTHPYYDLTGRLEKWLREHFLQVRDVTFFSNSSLHAQLFLPEIPVYTELPETVQQPVTVEFGDLLRLAGYSTQPPGTVHLPGHVELFWQVLEKPTRRYKYIWQLVDRQGGGDPVVLAAVEREPYEGDIPTLYWDPGKTIQEFVEFPCPATPPPPGAQPAFTFQVYDAESQQKLPVTRHADGEVLADGVSVAFEAGAAEWLAACAGEQNGQ